MIASITRSFAAEWVTKRLGVLGYLGTELCADGTAGHAWPQEQGRGWLPEHASELSVAPDRLAAVGDPGAGGEWDVGGKRLEATEVGFGGTRWP
jgi:hypothetical protein